MANKSNTQGRAYEYACLISLHKEISKERSVNIIGSPEVENCRKAWNELPKSQQNIYSISAHAAVLQVLELEPLITNNISDCVELLIQPDSAGIDGDVRDILIIRDSIHWEIGISVKHNHFAVKHSRLSKDIDFGKSWFGDSCSLTYWHDVNPIFDYLSSCKESKTEFNDIPNKNEMVYLPVLNAFIKEMQRLLSKDKKNPAKLVEYLLGKYDFYKMISIDDKKYTSVRAVNLHGTLNKKSPERESKYNIPVAKLPTRMIHIGLLPNSETTVELYLDNGWQFTFRIHNAEKIANPSLKFDIQIVGMPTAIITFNCVWRNGID